jgi:NADPH2:quinone reductase
VRAIRQYEFGGPETLCYEEIDDPVPAAGQVRIAVQAAGVHLIDASIRRGINLGATPLPDLPMIPGREVAGVVDALGPHVDPSWLNQRVVAHLGNANGGYASVAVADVDALFAVADNVDAAAAVAMVGTGRTALGILEVADVRADDVVVVTAAAGGIGALIVQAVRATGAVVVGATGGLQKVAAVEKLGAGLAVDYTADDWDDRIRTWLDGRPVTLALDGVAGAIGRRAFELVGAGGRMVVYGFASGEPMRFSVADLYAGGVAISAGIGPRVANRPGGIHALSEQALAELAAGRLKPLINPTFALGRAADAHCALEARATTGKVVLIPEPPLHD